MFDRLAPLYPSEMTPAERAATTAVDAGHAEWSAFLRTVPEDLRLNRTAVIGDEPAALRGLTARAGLGLAECPGVADAGLAHLRGLTRLADLNLHGTGVTDAGLGHPAGMTELRLRSLSATRVTAAGLASLKGLTRLSSLSLSHTKVTESGVAGLRGLTALRESNLDGTAVDGAGRGRLRAVFPRCTVGTEPR